MRRRHQKFFKKKDKDLDELYHRDRVLHSFCYTQSGLIIESIIFDSPQEEIMEDLKFNGLYVRGRFGFDGIGCGYFGTATKSEFRSKYQIGDIVKFHNKVYKHTAKVLRLSNSIIPCTSVHIDRTPIKRRIIDMEIAYDGTGRYKSRVLNIIYHTEEL